MIANTLLFSMAVVAMFYPAGRIFIAWTLLTSVLLWVALAMLINAH